MKLMEILESFRDCWLRVQVFRVKSPLYFLCCVRILFLYGLFITCFSFTWAFFLERGRGLVCAFFLLTPWSPNFSRRSYQQCRMRREGIRCAGRRTGDNSVIGHTTLKGVTLLYPYYSHLHILGPPSFYTFLFCLGPCLYALTVLLLECFASFVSWNCWFCGDWAIPSLFLLFPLSAIPLSPAFLSSFLKRIIGPGDELVSEQYVTREVCTVP